MRLTLLVSFAVVLATGCALRPRYADFVTARTAGKEVTFVILDAATHQPVPNAKVDVSELKNRIQVTTGVDGTFTLPVDKKYLDENPVFAVTLPRGFEQYQVVLAPLASAPVESANPDAGMPGSNG